MENKIEFLIKIFPLTLVFLNLSSANASNKYWDSYVVFENSTEIQKVKNVPTSVLKEFPLTGRPGWSLHDVVSRKTEESKGGDGELSLYNFDPMTMGNLSENTTDRFRVAIRFWYMPEFKAFLYRKIEPSLDAIDSINSWFEGTDFPSNRFVDIQIIGPHFKSKFYSKNLSDEKGLIVGAANFKVETDVAGNGVFIPDNIYKAAISHEYGHFLLDSYLRANQLEEMTDLDNLMALSQKIENRELEIMLDPTRSQNVKPDIWMTTTKKELFDIRQKINEFYDNPWDGGRLQVEWRRLQEKFESSKKKLQAYAEFYADLVAILQSNNLNAMEETVDFIGKAKQFQLKELEADTSGEFMARRSFETGSSQATMEINDLHGAFGQLRKDFAKSYLKEPLSDKLRGEVLLEVAKVIHREIVRNRSDLGPFDLAYYKRIEARFGEEISKSPLFVKLRERSLQCRTLFDD